MRGHKLKVWNENRPSMYIALHIQFVRTLNIGLVRIPHLVSLKETLQLGIEAEEIWIWRNTTSGCKETTTSRSLRYTTSTTEDNTASRPYTIFCYSIWVF